MVNSAALEQIALHHRAWDSRAVQYAVDKLAIRTEPHLSQILAEWREGLAQYEHWSSESALDFTNDMHRLLLGKGVRGSAWRTS